MLDRVLQEIRARHRFVVTSHARPDGDGIGSALACGQILRRLGKEAEVVMHDGVPRIYRNLPFADQAIQADSVPPNDAVILLECDGIKRTLLQGLEDCFLINIDHHVSGRNFAHINWIDPGVMATAELVYRMARLAGVPVDADIATCLYTGLMTDTGSFMFEGTGEHTFALARELVLAGADPAHCARHIYFGHSTAKLRLLGAALANLHREGPARLDLGHPGADGALRRPRGRLRGPRQLRALYRRCRGRHLPPRVARSPLARQPAQQGRSQRFHRRRAFRRRRPQMRQRLRSRWTPYHCGQPRSRTPARPARDGKHSMNLDLLRQLISFVGALLILIAYVGHQLGWVSARRRSYNVMNAAGSAILCWIALHPFQLGFIVLEGVWTVVSLWALVRPRAA